VDCNVSVVLSCAWGEMVTGGLAACPGRKGKSGALKDLESFTFET